MNITREESYFDGGLLQLIGWTILGGIITAITFGITYPWANITIQKWKVRNTEFR